MKFTMSDRIPTGDGETVVDRESREVLCPTTIVSFAPSLLCPKPPQPPRRKESLFKSIGRVSETKFEWHFGWTDGSSTFKCDHSARNEREKEKRSPSDDGRDGEGRRVHVHPLFPLLLLLHAMDGWRCPFSPLIIALYNLEKWTPVLQ